MIEKDPLWYKDAIIYELHVRAFYDSNGDGIGDFQGLIQKLDYLQSLGITAIWLLPFYPSPLKDDGYDISDYFAIHPNYGTLRDFKAFVREAHQRGIRVITELVINHTSDQHPWFQAARRAKPQSARRNFYVWSDTPDKFAETRIIFNDTEKSNWSWDEEASAYYWHRFFSHQPDLNHNNPRVVKAVLKVLRFWLDIGVDGLRLDAVPYLCVREGTSNENLLETHEVIKTFRREIDRFYQDRMLLAEANQWPEDVIAYFGDGDECHMAYHFPLMPRIFMAVRKEDRHPITEIIDRTPSIPPNCQWGLFLRNHDELTLEMVTDEERDYMYREYVTDPRMRINLGIRRRLAPLVENDPLTIQMLNSLLFSFPGTPIIYYGDEIGMGDNIYLGDRDGVRTPMQWSIDRNAGFSKADPAKLYHPVIMDPVYGYQAINVEAQERNQASLLNFMKRLISLRRQYKAFGRGSIEFLHPSNRKILAYIRRYKRETILCVVNLSRFIQPVELDLSEFKDLTPMEMFGRTEFPTIGELPYFLTLGPYAFYWFKLDPPAEPIRIQPLQTEEELSFKSIDLKQGWESLLEPANRHVLENDILPEYMPRQHWYIRRGIPLKSVRVTDWCKMGANFYFVFLQAEYDDGLPPENYFLPLRISTGTIAQTILNQLPGCILARVTTPKGHGVLFDAIYDESACMILLSSIEDGRHYLTSSKGRISSHTRLSQAELRKMENVALKVRQITLHGKNTAVFYGDWMVLKLYRRIENGPNPDIEMRQFLYERGGFRWLPRITGSIDYTATPNTPPVALGMLHESFPSQGDACTFTQVLMKTYLNQVADRKVARKAPPPVPDPDERIGPFVAPAPELVLKSLKEYRRFYALLGQRTAQMHLALAGDTRDKAFSPERISATDWEDLSEQFSLKAQHVLEQLNTRQKDLPPVLHSHVNQVLASGSAFIEIFQSLANIHADLVKIRCKGNFHLANVLKMEDDLLFVYFEGNLQLPLAERRKKQTPLVDVASMICSIYQASTETLDRFTRRKPMDTRPRYDVWAQLWRQGVAHLFLSNYLEHIGEGSRLMPKDKKVLSQLVSAFILEHTFMQLGELLDTRPDEIQWPLEVLMNFANHK